MKFYLLFAALIAAASAVTYEDVFIQEYNLYKAQFGKSYDDPLENARRMEIFLNNKYEVAKHNLKYKNGEETYEMEINHFSDWLPEEFENMNGFNKEYRDRLKAGETVTFPKSLKEIYETSLENLPSSVNWVEKGAVSPVKNQGACGSCYAFSANGALESHLYLKTKKMVRLSEQQIVDCSGRYGNMGCKGGLHTSTFEYIKDNNGVNTEASYPYEGVDGNCRYKKENNAVSCFKYRGVKETEEALQEAVAQIGPISVAISAIDSLMRYKSGVYYDISCKNNIESLNHAVVLVGYGTDPKTKEDYWLVKNSWGTNWGEKGYVRMARNKNNMCGIATFAVYPRVKLNF